MSDVNPRNDFMDSLQDRAYPPDYPASVAFVLRKLYAGRSLLEGYLYEGRFYSDRTYTVELPATRERIYVDVPSGTAFRWNGEAFVTLSVQTGDDLQAVHYVAEDRSEAQKAQARSNMGAAAASDLRAVAGDVSGLKVKAATWDGKQDALAFDAQPVEGSGNPVRSGGIFSWVKGLFESMTLRWDKVAGKPTTVAGYGITDAVRQVKVGDAVPVSPDASGIVRIPGARDAKAVHFDRAETLTDAERLMARQNIGVTTTNITARAGAVAAAWSERMSDREKTALLNALVAYVKEKEGIT